MEVLFTAAGSIGARHIRNLDAVCKEKGLDLQIDVIRHSQRELAKDVKELLRREVREDVQLAGHYDVVFVTDETKTHFANILKYRGRCSHMFIEKPVFADVNTPIEKVLPIPENAVYYVAAPIRFSKYFLKLAEYAKIEEIYAARIIFSSYMPDWQKGRDYRNSFRCFSDRGGGVDIDSLHEIDYMTALFGRPEDVLHAAGKYSNLAMEACDLADYIFRYPDKLVELHLDYFGRVNNRRTELFTKEDVIVVDFHKKTAVRQLSGETEMFGPDDDFYLEEMRYFLDLVLLRNKKRNINTVENAYETLKLAKGCVAETGGVYGL